MKKTLFLSMLAAFVGFTSCSKSDDGLQQNVDNQSQTTFTIESPDTRGQVTEPTRYIVEAYEGANNAETLAQTPQRVESATGSLTLNLKKNTEYTFVFWADQGTASTAIATSGDYYDATQLQDVKVNPTAYATTATPAYCLTKTFNSKDFEANKTVVLKNATAQINFVEAAGLMTSGNSLAVKYSSGGKLNVATGKITEIGTEISRTYTNIGKIEKDKALAIDYILAPLSEQRILDLKVTFNSEAEKEITNVPLQQNYKTNIKGEYSNAYSSVFTISNEVGDYIDNPDVEFGKPTFMSLTIDTRKNTDNAADKTFILPLSATLKGYALTVDWGDSNIEKFADGTVLAQDNMTHTYAAAGEYTITISSSQEDDSKAQMPSIIFYNYKDVNKNNLKLISIDTPLLNMGTDLSSCFLYCSSLASIPTTLFEKNTAATNFKGCFAYCTSLTSIPATLFEKNTAATNFKGCFMGCKGLTSIPTTLFEKNTAVTDFSDCFDSCKGLTSIPTTLFEKNTAATSFRCCFQSCKVTSIPATLFEKNTAVTDFSYCFSFCSSLVSIPATLFEKNTAATSFRCCFQGCDGLTSIPATLFEKNTAVTDFSYCFSLCTKAVLNSDIFCSEASDKATRFDGMQMDFNNCFQNCGNDSSVAASGGGTAPELWDYIMESGSNKTRCFINVTKVTNATSIPTEWK